MYNLSKMVNEIQIDFEGYLKMHPFSLNTKDVYDPALEGINYYEELHIKTIGMFKRLAEITDVLNNQRQNLIMITGYCGTGKTNFVHFIEHLVNGGNINKTLAEVASIQRPIINDSDELKKWDEQYKIIQDEIYHSLKGYLNRSEITEKALNIHIENSLRGNSTYINFDMGGVNADKPLSLKLYQHLKEELKETIANGEAFEVLDNLEMFIGRHGESIDHHFETDQEDKLRTFWKNMKFEFGIAKETKRTDGILKLIKEINLTQLLLVYILWDYVYRLLKDKKACQRKYIYLFDNIDMIANGDGSKLRNTIDGIFTFDYCSRMMFSEIKEKSIEAIDREICEYYYNSNFIIAMRETSAMRITEHYRKMVRQNMRCFDISEDVDKELLLKVKLGFAKKLINEHEITNHYFINKINNLECLLNDPVQIRRLCDLNNNDVRTSIELISKLCEKDFTSLLRQGRQFTGFQLFGMRGIILKNIFSIFEGDGYLRRLKVNDYRNKSYLYPFSSCRIVLVLLYSQKHTHVDRTVLSDAEYIELSQLYNEVTGIISREEFEDILDAMYSLREEAYWNHLITFDNLASYSRDDLSRYLGSDEHNDDEKVYLSITTAGKEYVERICTHFEFFSQRFYPTNKKALFELNYFFDEDRQIVKDVITAVYEAVQRCCTSLAQYNLQVLEKTKATHYKGIL